jgi:hypothetical protein
LYNVFLQEDSLGDYSLVHKAHPWASNSTWRKSEANALAISNNQKTNIYPIPFDNEIKFTVPSVQENEQWTISISDIQGRQILKSTGSVSDLNKSLNETAPKLASGTYILQYSSARGEKNHFKAIKK